MVEGEEEKSDSWGEEQEAEREDWIARVCVEVLPVCFA